MIRISSIISLLWYQRYQTILHLYQLHFNRKASASGAFSLIITFSVADTTRPSSLSLVGIIAAMSAVMGVQELRARNMLQRRRNQLPRRKPHLRKHRNLIHLIMWFKFVQVSSERIRIFGFLLWVFVKYDSNSLLPLHIGGSALLDHV